MWPQGQSDVVMTQCFSLAAQCHERVCASCHQTCGSHREHVHCRWRQCFSDQHLLASVLSYKGLENETFCNATLTNSDSGDPQRPHSFMESELSIARYTPWLQPWLMLDLFM